MTATRLLTTACTWMSGDCDWSIHEPRWHRLRRKSSRLICSTKFWGLCASRVRGRPSRCPFIGMRRPASSSSVSSPRRCALRPGWPMTDPIVVFLGPTLERSQAARYLDAVYHRPAEQGSVVSAIRTLNPRALVLIDGSFARVPAVRHKEILWALSLGIPVYGAGSMGALRAAELWPFGMQGFGLVYRWYRATPLADDDEVAVAMTPPELGAAALSDALINMRLTLRGAERRGGIPREVRVALENAARSLHFMERTYADSVRSCPIDFSGRMAGACGNCRAVRRRAEPSIRSERTQSGSCSDSPRRRPIDPSWVKPQTAFV